MGADAFYVCYGLRWEVSAASEELRLLEKREDPRQVAAKKHKLDTSWGATTDQTRYLELIGKLIGDFGWEGEHDTQLEDEKVARLVEDTKRKLRAAGFENEPAWYYQFEPDY